MLVLVFAGLALFYSSARAEGDDHAHVHPVRIFLFHSETCPHCHDEIEFLEKVQKDFPNVEVHEFEVSKNLKNRSLFSRVLERHNLSGGVPVTIIENEAIVGFDNEKGVGAKVMKKIKICSGKICESWLDETLSLEKITEDSKICVDDKALEKLELNSIEECSDTGSSAESEDDTTQVFGKNFNLSNKSVVGLGVILGLADGINPCMFSVLLFLLTYLLAVGSRRRAFKAGIAFVVTTFILYFLFMLGIIRVIDVLKIAEPVRLTVSILAFILGIIMIKDFFFYGKGISLEISEKHKPKIEELIKKGTVPSAILLAIFAGLVEIPCTSGIPLAYVTILAERGLDPIASLLLYNFFFILPILAIVLAVTFAWAKVDVLEEKRVTFRKWMRLIAGILLVLLAFSLWFNWL